MAKSVKKKSGKGNKKAKVGRFKAGYRAVMTDRVRLLLFSCAVISFVIVVAVIVLKRNAPIVTVGVPSVGNPQ